MKLRILGCNGLYPLARGACSSYLISLENKHILLDIGTGSLANLLEFLDPLELEAILISHWHFDHYSDLLPLSYYLQQKGKKLKVYSPKLPNALKELLNQNTFEFQNIDHPFRTESFSVDTMLVNHPIESYAIKVSADGSSIVYTGDTVYFDALVEFAIGCNALLCDAAFISEKWAENLPHMNAKQAGKLAEKAKVKQLLLTHIAPGQIFEKIEAEAKTEFKNAKCVSIDDTYEL